MYDTLNSLYSLWQTVLLRPYVFAFLAVYLVAASAHLGWRRALLFLPVGYGLAWCSEYCSVNWGFPFGDYYYITATKGQELWVEGVPFMDSLSFVFLSYCSYSTAVFLLSPVAFKKGDVFVLETHSIRRSWNTALLAAALMAFLDLIIDPVTLRGYRWFLGQIYGYPEPGVHFGVPISNYIGWFVTGLVLVRVLQLMDWCPHMEPRRASSLLRIPGILALGPVLHFSVLVFNLAVTIWIGERMLFLVGCLLVFFPLLISLLYTVFKHNNLTERLVEAHVRDYPYSKAVALRFSIQAREHVLELPGSEPLQEAQAGRPVVVRAVERLCESVARKLEAFE